MPLSIEDVSDEYCTHCNETACICDSGEERTYRKPYGPNCGEKIDGGADNAVN